MLTLTRPLRQVLYTGAVVLFTVVPTAFVAWTAWHVNQPGHVREVEAELGRQLGLRVTLEGVRYPKPGAIVYQGAVLWQAEPRQQSKLVEVARARTVHLTRHDRQVVLRAEGLELRGEGPKAAMTQVGELFRRAGDADWDQVSVSADSCVVLLGDEEDGLRYNLRKLAGIFRADRETPSISASYSLVTPEGSANRCELTLTRDRRSKDVRTTLTFQTAEGLPLPAQVLDPFFDSNDWLGPKARVQGTLSLAQVNNADWEAKFQGVLANVDLSALIGRRVPDHRLSGLARVALDSARWGRRPGGNGIGWVSAKGELTAGPGLVSASLLRALQAEMNIRLDARLSLQPRDLEYQALGLAFAMTPDGEMALDGALGTAYEPNAILIEPNALASMAYAPDGSSNLIGLRRTLGPPNARQDILVPVTAELQFLNHLPIPSGPRPGHAVAN